MARDTAINSGSGAGGSGVMRHSSTRRKMPLRPGFAILLAGLTVAGCASVESVLGPMGNIFSSTPAPPGPADARTNKRWCCRGALCLRADAHLRRGLSASHRANRRRHLAASAGNRFHQHPLSGIARSAGARVRRARRYHDGEGRRRRARAGGAEGRPGRSQRSDSDRGDPRRSATAHAVDQVLFRAGDDRARHDAGRLRPGRGRRHLPAAGEQG